MLDWTEEIRQRLAESAATPLIWLIGPVERALALLVHASSRALVLLGVAYKRPWMVWGGLAIFTAVDGIAGGAIVFRMKHAGFSAWWIELAIAPLAVLGVFILRWCYRQWPNRLAVAV